MVLITEKRYRFTVCYILPVVLFFFGTYVVDRVFFSDYGFNPFVALFEIIRGTLLGGILFLPFALLPFAFWFLVFYAGIKRARKMEGGGKTAQVLFVTVYFLLIVPGMVGAGHFVEVTTSYVPTAIEKEQAIAREKAWDKTITRVIEKQNVSNSTR